MPQAATTLSPNKALLVDAGFAPAALLGVTNARFVARVRSNQTARRAVVPVYKGRGPRPKRGDLVRLLPRTRAGKTLPATPPDETAHWYEGKHRLIAQVWNRLVLPRPEAGGTDLSDRSDFRSALPAAAAAVDHAGGAGVGGVASVSGSLAGGAVAAGRQADVGLRAGIRVRFGKSVSFAGVGALGGQYPLVCGGDQSIRRLGFLGSGRASDLQMAAAGVRSSELCGVVRLGRTTPQKEQCHGASVDGREGTSTHQVGRRPTEDGESRRIYRKPKDKVLNTISDIKTANKKTFRRAGFLVVMGLFVVIQVILNNLPKLTLCFAAGLCVAAYFIIKKGTNLQSSALRHINLNEYEINASTLSSLLDLYEQFSTSDERVVVEEKLLYVMTRSFNLNDLRSYDIYRIARLLHQTGDNTIIAALNVLAEVGGESVIQPIKALAYDTKLKNTNPNLHAVAQQSYNKIFKRLDLIKQPKILLRASDESSSMEVTLLRTTNEDQDTNTNSQQLLRPDMPPKI